MSGSNSPVDRVALARDALERVRQCLLRPTPASLDECGQPLSEAAEALRALQAALNSEGPADRPRDIAADVHRELAGIRSLLEQAGAFYLGWSRILHSAAGTYGASGELRAPDGETMSFRC